MAHDRDSGVWHLFKFSFTGAFGGETETGGYFEMNKRPFVSDNATGMDWPALSALVLACVRACMHAFARTPAVPCVYIRFFANEQLPSRYRRNTGE